MLRRGNERGCGGLIIRLSGNDFDARPWLSARLRVLNAGVRGKMVDDGLTGFERAVRDALDRLGMGLLGRPQEFTGAVADLHDPDSPEVTVLYLHCSDELLRPFAEAARAGTTDALERAARRAELWLHDARRVTTLDSHVVAWGIARGVAAHLGIGLFRDPDGGSRAGEGEATGAAVERARAVLADTGAAEADVADALDVIRALPDGTQGKSGLEPALERRLGKLVAEREAGEARRAEEERLRLEAEERERAEAARKRREERDRLLAEREARRRAATSAGPATEPKPRPRSKLGIAVVLAVIVCVALVVALVAGSSPKSDGGSGPTLVATKAEDEPGVPVRASVDEYSWEEMKKLSNAISAADSDKAGIKIAEEHNLVDSDGKLQGDTKTVILADYTKTSVRILGFRHDDLAGGGKAGITFEFADIPTRHYMNAKGTNDGGWEASEMRAWLNSDFLNMLPDDLRECVEPAEKLTNNKGKVGEGETSAVTSTKDLLWLPSSTEVYGSEKGSWADVYDAEGSQYQLYADQGVTTSDYEFCEEDKGGKYSSWWSLRSWWLRSPNPAYEHKFLFVDSFWGHCDSGGVKDAFGVSPGFCL